MEKGWMVLMQHSSLATIELLKALLLENGVQAIVLNQQDSAYQTIGDISLLVHKEDLLRARNILKQSAFE